MKQIAYILIFIPIILNAQNGWENVDVSTYFETLRDFEKSIPENEDYSLSMSYAIFNDYADKAPINSFKGKVICKKGTQLNVSQMGLFVVQDEHYNVLIDSANLQILIQNPDSSFFYRKTLSDYKIAEAIIQSVQMKVTNNIKTLNVEMKNGAPYRAMEISFLNNNEISKIVIYGNQPYYTENDSNLGKKEMVVINFERLITGEDVDMKDFKNIDEFIIINGNEITPTDKYKDFEIIDLRN